MKREKQINNKGYSLVELIIVIAIIGILSALSLVTWRSVESANYKKSVSTFESELRTLRAVTMAQSKDMAMKLYLGDDGRYYIERGVYDGTTFAQPTDGTTLANSDYYKYQGTSNPVSVTKKGLISFDGTVIDENGIIIQFNKSDGSISTANGGGTYTFTRRNGDLVTNVKINKTTGLFTESY